ncbi:MAG: ribonuclease HII [Tissierellia bacterium]|nr:ribonuclease HII [Tissierellia bacterium]
MSELMAFDAEIRSNRGVSLLGGVDEAGRGCLFGDVVAACVVMAPDTDIEGVRDSKKLSPKKRELLYDRILEEAAAVGVGRATAQEIDEVNIRQATLRAMARAIEAAGAGEFFLIDAEKVPLEIPQMAIVRGDDTSFAIACASIVAKVTRDRLCLQWEEAHPGYGIAQHKGYGTKAHREQILALGPSPLHRRSFLKKLLRDS